MPYHSFIPLVRDADAWERLYGEVLEFTSGTLKTYCTRGWCRLELLAALAPKRYPTGVWRQGSVNMRFRVSVRAFCVFPPSDSNIHRLPPRSSTTIRWTPARGRFCAPSTS